MTKSERAHLGKLVNKIYDGLPGGKECECFNLEGEDSGEECDLHWSLRKLNDVANGTETLASIMPSS